MSISSVKGISMPPPERTSRQSPILTLSRRCSLPREGTRSNGEAIMFEPMIEARNSASSEEERIAYEVGAHVPLQLDSVNVSLLPLLLSLERRVTIAVYATEQLAKFHATNFAKLSQLLDDAQKTPLAVVYKSPSCSRSLEYLNSGRAIVTCTRDWIILAMGDASWTAIFRLGIALLVENFQLDPSLPSCDPLLTLLDHVTSTSLSSAYTPYTPHNTFFPSSSFATSSHPPAGPYAMPNASSAFLYEPIIQHNPSYTHMPVQVSPILKSFPHNLPPRVHPRVFITYTGPIPKYSDAHFPALARLPVGITTKFYADWMSRAATLLRSPKSRSHTPNSPANCSLGKSLEKRENRTPVKGERSPPFTSPAVLRLSGSTHSLGIKNISSTENISSNVDSGHQQSPYPGSHSSYSSPCITPLSLSCSSIDSLPTTRALPSETTPFPVQAKLEIALLSSDSAAFQPYISSKEGNSEQSMELFATLLQAMIEHIVRVQPSGNVVVHLWSAHATSIFLRATKSLTGWKATQLHERTPASELPIWLFEKLPKTHSTGSRYHVIFTTTICDKHISVDNVGLVIDLGYKNPSFEMICADVSAYRQARAPSSSKYVNLSQLVFPDHLKPTATDLHEALHMHTDLERSILLLGGSGHTLHMLPEYCNDSIAYLRQSGAIQMCDSGVIERTIFGDFVLQLGPDVRWSCAILTGHLHHRIGSELALIYAILQQPRSLFGKDFDHDQLGASIGDLFHHIKGFFMYCADPKEKKRGSSSRSTWNSPSSGSLVPDSITSIPHLPTSVDDQLNEKCCGDIQKLHQQICEGLTRITGTEASSSLQHTRAHIHDLAYQTDLCFKISSSLLPHFEHLIRQCMEHDENAHRPSSWTPPTSRGMTEDSAVQYLVFEASRDSPSVPDSTTQAMIAHPLFLDALVPTYLMRRNPYLDQFGVPTSNLFYTHFLKQQHIVSEALRKLREKAPSNTSVPLPTPLYAL